MMNMDILCQVLSLLSCNEYGCCGSMLLHKPPRSDGLQSYLIIHCNRCHTFVAQFSSSLHIGESPVQSVNNPRMTKKRETEVNSRVLVALHSTSMSWRDFLLLFSHGSANAWSQHQQASTREYEIIYITSCRRIYVSSS